MVMGWGVPMKKKSKTHCNRPTYSNKPTYLNRLDRREFILKSITLGGSFLFFPSHLFAKPAAESPWKPAYEKLEEKGLLAQRIEQAYSIFESCKLCPRECGVNRIKGEEGFCTAPAQPVVYSAHPHFGEEISLVGSGGSGTIFLSNCNLRCIFCQNWPIAHEGRGKRIKEQDLADMMINLQRIGCHNINFVTPTHYMPNILKATRLALKKGLSIPLVYNTSGYERVEIVRILDGVVDIYLPDLKYMDSKMAETYSSGASDYPEMAQRAIMEMNRQVGEHVTNEQGVALRGVMIRHLVMPNRVASTEQFVKWVAENLPKSTYVNIMPQYRVEYKAFEYPKIARRITVAEFLEAMEWAESAGLTNLDPNSLAVKGVYEFFQPSDK
jgi:putative pyruvate formate lyase activating enzyme